MLVAFGSTGFLIYVVGMGITAIYRALTGPRKEVIHPNRENADERYN